jgi:hypothetical protein
MDGQHGTTRAFQQKHNRSPGLELTGIGCIFNNHGPRQEVWHFVSEGMAFPDSNDTFLCVTLYGIAFPVIEA